MASCAIWEVVGGAENLDLEQFDAPASALPSPCFCLFFSQRDMDS